ncbi:MAG: putative metal-dependent hydrolase, partial [Calditrichaeota bacterium]|nr:putative metal-dependent hydrolase [Calditrichota bacterium]
MTDLRYPIGPFQAPGKTTSAQRRQWIETIAATPEKLRRAVAGLSEAQLETPYRPGGWTVRQVVHHLPDSHLNSYVRFKLALTEETPAIKPYWEDRWAELADSKGPIDISLNLLEAL